VDGQDDLARQFEARRGRLRAVAYRMLGSLSEADDAVQETWLALSRGDAGQISSLDGWLTTAVSRACLKTLRTRRARREVPLDWHVPDPVVTGQDGGGPEQAALLAGDIGLALLTVLDTLAPAERLAFVLHDMFAVPFDQIAVVLARTPAAARQLASRARRRVRRAAPVPDPDPARQREVVEAFFAASRKGDIDALIAVLAPDVVVRSDGGPARPGLSAVLRGAADAAKGALGFARLSPFVHPVLVNGAAGAVAAPNGRPYSVMAFTVTGGKITAVHILADPDRLRRLDLPLNPPPPH
jgi:RNA polymerase sigma factor (sigma-70 family)